MNYLDEIKKKYPKIKAFEEDDEEWENLGYLFFKNEEYSRAEEYFSKLCLAQPEHQGGYEGLAYTYYSLRKKEKALWFMEEALHLAKKFLEDDSIDEEVIEMMEQNLKNIKNNEELIIW